MENYAVRELIGKGAFGDAYLVTRRAKGAEDAPADANGVGDGGAEGNAALAAAANGGRGGGSSRTRRYILKKIRLARQSERQRVASLQEMALATHARLRHPYIVGAREAWIERGCMVHIVSQYCDGGDLYNVLRRARGRYFAEEQILEWAAQLLLAVDHLHSNNIIHRDIKSANVFLKRDGTARLGDLGLCKVLEHAGARATAVVGTPNYMAPEMLNDQPYGLGADIWSLGCVLYELAALRPAFTAFNVEGLADKIKKGSVAALPAHFSQPTRALIRSMLRRSAAERPSAAELLKHPLVAPLAARYMEESASEGVAPSLLPTPAATPRAGDSGGRAPGEAALGAALAGVDGHEERGEAAVRLLCESIARGRTLSSDDIAALRLCDVERAAREAAGALSAGSRTSNGAVDGADVSARSRLPRPRTAHARTRAAAPGEDRADAPDAGSQTHRSATGDARAAHHRAEGKRERPKSARLARGGRPRSDVVAAWVEEQKLLQEAHTGARAKGGDGTVEERSEDDDRHDPRESPRLAALTRGKPVPKSARSSGANARGGSGAGGPGSLAALTGKGGRGTHDANAKQAHAADAQMAGSEATFGTATKARKPPVPKINMKRVKSKGGKPGQLAGVVKGEEDGARDARGTDRNATRAEERRGARAGADAPSPAVESTLGGETAIDAADGNDAGATAEEKSKARDAAGSESPPTQSRPSPAASPEGNPRVHTPRMAHAPAPPIALGAGAGANAQHNPPLTQREVLLESVLALCARAHAAGDVKALGLALEAFGGSGEQPSAPITFQPGDYVMVGDREAPLQGTIRYYGRTAFAPGEWVGIELSQPLGKNDGSVDGVRYFACGAWRGLFVAADALRPATGAAEAAPDAAMARGIETHVSP
eukprot:PRCOL_00006618-RA